MTQYRSSRIFAFALLVSAAPLVSGCASNNKAPEITGSVTAPPGGPLGAPQATNKPTETTSRNFGQQLPRQSALVDETRARASEFQRNPNNVDNALQYVYNLRQLGMSEQATMALAEVYRNNPDDPRVASEYGRMLVGVGKDNQAEKVLERAANEDKDWRALSALGTVAARAGNYTEATTYFRRANEIEPKRASIVNNLALALALDGKPDEAENLLRNADDSGNFGPRLRQNLALVLALQGKYDEAQSVATTDLPPPQAAANIAYIKKMTGAAEVNEAVEFHDETIPAAKAKPQVTARTKSPAPGAPTQLTPPDDGPATTASLPAKPY